MTDVRLLHHELDVLLGRPRGRRRRRRGGGTCARDRSGGPRADHGRADDLVGTDALDGEDRDLGRLEDVLLVPGTG